MQIKKSCLNQTSRIEMKPIVVVDCVDKKFITHDKNPLLPSGGERMILAGRSNSGKGSLAKNIIGRLNPSPYDSNGNPHGRIVCLHYSPESTDEWDDLGAEMIAIDGLPEITDANWDRTKKNVLIIDELPIKSLPRVQCSLVTKYFEFGASHYNIIILLLAQNFASIPTAIRRSAEYWIIWKSTDKIAQSHITAVTGHDMRQLAGLCKSTYDTITFNFTNKPHRLRLNLFEPIDDREDPSDSDSSDDSDSD
jgi:hypothetical protein